MEAKAIFSIFSYFGFPAAFLGIVYNWGEVRSLLLFALGAGFMVVKIIFYVVEKIDARDARKIQMENDRLDLEYKKEGHERLRNLNQ